MGGDDGLGNGQSHAGTTHLIPLIAAAIKLVEDEALFKRVDARTMIGNAEGNGVAGQFGGNSDGLILRRIKMGVIDQLHKNILSALEIGADGGRFSGTFRIIGRSPSDFLRCCSALSMITPTGTGSMCN